MKSVLSILLLAALTGAAHSQLRKIYIFVNLKQNFWDALNYCKENYANLAKISSQEDQNLFQIDAGAQCQSAGCWIGMTKYQPGKILKWTDQSELNFTYWSELQPSGVEECVSTYDRWLIYDCNLLLNFVCYVWDSFPVVAVQEMKTWVEALNYCRMNYTDLVSLITESDQTAVDINSRRIQTSYFWTGLRFLDGSWFWVNQNAMLEASLLSNTIIMPSCPAPRFCCGARNTTSDVLEFRDCEEKLNFICYSLTMI